VNTAWGVARELPFRDRYFDLTVSVAVLIHQPDETLGAAIDELVRCSTRWITVVEYTADQTIEVNYRGELGAFFKRPYGRIIGERHPDLRLAVRRELTKDDGFDDGLECFVYERP
jgi:hypothetical protein